MTTGFIIFGVIITVMILAVIISNIIIYQRTTKAQIAIDEKEKLFAMEKDVLAQKQQESDRYTQESLVTLKQTVQILQSQQQQYNAQILEKVQAQEKNLAGSLFQEMHKMNTQVLENLKRSHVHTANIMGDVKSRLSVIDSAQQNIANLSEKVVSLQEVLSNKQARGAFGEIQLQDLVTSIMPPGSFEFQAGVGEKYRADCLLKLPNPPGPIVVDSKFPLEAYHQIQQAKTDQERVQAGRFLIQSTTKHIQDIAKKYIVPGETAESALMFLPSEAVYAEIYAHFPQIVEFSFKSKVFIVSPTTLWATLNTIRAILRDVQMRKNAHILQKEVIMLVQDIHRLDERVGKLQRHFDMGQEDIRQIRISTEKIIKKRERIEAIDLAEDGKEGDKKAIENAVAGKPSDSKKIA